MRVVIGLVLSRGLVRGDTDAEVTRQSQDGLSRLPRGTIPHVLAYRGLVQAGRDLVLYVFGVRYDKAKTSRSTEIEFLGYGTQWQPMDCNRRMRAASATGSGRSNSPTGVSTRIQRACHASRSTTSEPFHPVLWNEKCCTRQADAGLVRGCPFERRRRLSRRLLAYIPTLLDHDEARARGLAFKTSPNIADQSRSDMVYPSGSGTRTAGSMIHAMV